MYRNTRGVNLYEAWISEISTLAIGLDGSGTVTSHGVGREEVGVAITTSGQTHGMCGKANELACYEILGDDTTGAAVDNHHIFHLHAGVELHRAVVHLFHQ